MCPVSFLSIRSRAAYLREVAHVEGVEPVNLLIRNQALVQLSFTRKFILVAFAAIRYPVIGPFKAHLPRGLIYLVLR